MQRGFPLPAVVSNEDTIRVTWIGRTKQELIETARAQLPRELTDEERQRFDLTGN